VLNICFKELFVLLMLIPRPVFALLAENMAYLTEKCDEYKDPAIYNEYPCEYLNLSAVYMLSALAASQSMNKIGFAFKNLKNAQLILSKRFPTVDGLAVEHEHVSDTPYITRQTVAYAISLTVSALFYGVNDESNKGRADEVYAMALRDLEHLSDDKFYACFGELLLFYVEKVTSPEPPDFGTLEQLVDVRTVSNSVRDACNAARAATNDITVANRDVELPVVRGPAVTDAPASDPECDNESAAKTKSASPAKGSKKASDSDVSVAKSSSGSDNESAAKTNSASPAKGSKKAGRGRQPTAGPGAKRGSRGGAR
jgi:hypothetical protein